MRLSALWFGLQFFWASQQLIVMPERVEHFIGDAQKGTYLGLIKSCGAIVVLVTQLSIGFISDHTEAKLGRRRPWILYGMFSGLGAIAFFMLAPNYWWLFAAYMLIEATINAASVPFQALLPDLVPEEQHARAGTQMGLNHLFGNLVGLLMVIAMQVLLRDDLVPIFGDLKPSGYIYVLLPAYIVVLSVTTLIVAGVDELGWLQNARRVLDGPVREIRMLPGVVLRYIETAPTLLGAIALNYLRLDLRGNMDFTWLALSRFAVNLGYHTFLTFVAYYSASNLDRTAFLAGLGLDGRVPESMVLPLMLIFFILGGLAGNLLSAPLSERFGKKAVIGSGLVFAALLFVGLIFTSDVRAAIGLGLALGIGWGAFIAADWAFACTLMPKQHAGTYMGVWDVTTLLPQVIAPLFGGLLRDGIRAEYVAALGERGANALAYQWVFATVVVYFAAGLWLLRYVRERRGGATAPRS